MALFNLESHVTGDLAKAHVRNRRQHRLRFRRDVLALLDAEEVGGTALLDVFVLSRIEVHHVRIAERVRLFTRHEAGRIVSADLHITRSTWSSAVLFTVDSDQNRLDSRLEVGTYGRAIDDQQRILGGFHTQSDGRTEHHRTQVERSTRTVGRNETLVALDHLDTGINNHLDRRNRQAKALGRRLKTAGIVGHTEETDLAVDSPEGFQTLEKFDAVVQARSRHVHLDVLVARDFHLAPLAVGKRKAGIEIGLGVVEAQCAPIDVFHKY